jgi:hypothetical protein
VIRRILGNGVPTKIPTDSCDSTFPKKTDLSVYSQSELDKVALRLSAIGDYGGFTHADLDHPAADGASAQPRFGNTNAVASAPLPPEIVIRAGISAKHKPDANFSYSLDGGKTWQPTGATPATGSRLGTAPGPA